MSADFLEFAPIDLDATLTPADVDRYLRRLNNACYYAEKELRQARNREVECEKAYSRASQPLLMDPECPDPSKSGVSNAMQEKWLSARIPDPYWAFREAKTVRMNAQSQVARLEQQIKCVQSINTIVRQMYGLPGGNG